MNRTVVLFFFFATLTLAQSGPAQQELDAVFPSARALYLDLHASPELSSHEVNTAAKLASRLRDLGFDVTEHVGGTGIVALLRNGSGPSIMLRTELDALPVEEKTGLPYASKVHTRNDSGEDVPVAHACGHDLHMAALVGTAGIMAKHRDSWQGTLMLIAQPAEETISGAKAMLADGLLTRFPKPDAGVALHVMNLLPAGQVGVGSGFRFANADSVRITIYGKGGHGASPETTVDPIVVAAKAIVSLQTIVSREIKTGDVAVVTVGYIHAGTKNNIIPDTAQLGLTVRSYKPEVRAHLLASIDRIVRAEALSAGTPREPLIEHTEATDAVVNDSALSARCTAALKSALGKGNVVELPPVMGSEDYSVFVAAGIPSFYFVLGGAEPAKFAEAKAKGENLPSNHSPLFAPDLDPALQTAMESEVAVLRNLMAAGR